MKKKCLPYIWNRFWWNKIYETGPDGFLYILTLDRESDGEGKFIELYCLNNILFFVLKPAKPV